MVTVKKVLLINTDENFMQIINNDEYNIDNFTEKTGLKPYQIIELKTMYSVGTRFLTLMAKPAHMFNTLTQELCQYLEMPAKMQ